MGEAPPSVRGEATRRRSEVWLMAGPDINAMVHRAARQAATKREAARKTKPDPARMRKDAPTIGAVDPGDCLILERHEGRYCHLLAGSPLQPGAIIEVYTNRANGWIRGRYEWSGRPSDLPRLVVNLWNPHGEPDADGLPPLVGEIDSPIPEGAICRPPKTSGGRGAGE